jgi:hypothetical protein
MMAIEVAAEGVPFVLRKIATAVFQPTDSKEKAFHISAYFPA